MIFVESDGTDARYNLALEQYMFGWCDRDEGCLMLWKNHNTIVVGKHQNTAAEVNAEYVRDHEITVVRRLSGGGAVYHDLGNLNYTIITGDEGDSFDFARFCVPVVEALRSLSVPAEVSGRNDIVIDGKKISGSAQYKRDNKIMHHGTLLFDSDLRVLGEALNAAPEKLQSKGIASVRSRVTNIKPYLKTGMVMDEFYETLKRELSARLSLRPYALSDEDREQVLRIKRDRYDRWEWNYGASPAYTIKKSKRIDGVGKIEIYLEVASGGAIRDVVFFGDYFGDGQELLKTRLVGAHLEEQSLRAALAGLDVGECIHGLDREALLSILLL
jgi:lipoate-protein ligase A